MNYVLRWLQQPTSVAGMATIFGTFSAVLMHQVTAAQAVPLLVGSLISLVLPDNAGAKASASALASSIVSEVSNKEHA